MKLVARTPKQLAAILRRTRRQAGLTQAQLGEKAGMWQETISKIEGGNTATRMGTLFELLAALDLELVVQERSKGSPMEIEDIF